MLTLLERIVQLNAKKAELNIYLKDTAKSELAILSRDEEIEKTYQELYKVNSQLRQLEQTLSTRIASAKTANNR